MARSRVRKRRRSIRVPKRLRSSAARALSSARKYQRGNPNRRQANRSTRKAALTQIRTIQKVRRKKPAPSFSAPAKKTRKSSTIQPNSVSRHMRPSSLKGRFIDRRA